jgi:hypothetical protein
MYQSTRLTVEYLLWLEDITPQKDIQIKKLISRIKSFCKRGYNNNDRNERISKIQSNKLNYRITIYTKSILLV